MGWSLDAQQRALFESMSLPELVGILRSRDIKRDGSPTDFEAAQAVFDWLKTNEVVVWELLRQAEGL